MYLKNALQGVHLIVVVQGHVSKATRQIQYFGVFLVISHLGENTVFRVF